MEIKLQELQITSTETLGIMRCCGLLLCVETMSPILPLPYPVPPHCAICRSIASLNVVVDNNEEGIVHRSSIYLSRKGFRYLHRQDVGKASHPITTFGWSQEM